MSSSSPLCPSFFPCISGFECELPQAELGAPFKPQSTSAFVFPQNLLHKAPHGAPYKALRRETQQLAFTLHTQIDRIITSPQAQGETAHTLQQVAHDGIQQLCLNTQMHATATERNAYEANRLFTASQCAQIDHNITSMQLSVPLSPPLTPPVPSSVSSSSSYSPDLSSMLERLQTHQAMEHVAQVAVAATAFRALDKVTEFLVDTTVTGVVKGTQAVCSIHPTVQQGCDNAFEGGAQFVHMIHDQAAEYWNGSGAEKGFLKLSDALNTPSESSPSMEKVLRAQGFSSSEIKAYTDNVDSVMHGATDLCLTVAGVNLIKKAGKAVKTMQTAGTVAGTTRAAKVAHTAQAAQTVEAVQAVSATPAAPVVQAAPVLQAVPAVPASTVATATAAATEATKTTAIVRSAFAKKQIAAHKHVTEVISREADLLANLVAPPFVKPDGFPEHIYQFYKRCTPHYIRGSNLGRQGGSYSRTLLSLNNRDHIFFLMRDPDTLVKTLADRGIKQPLVRNRQYVSSVEMVDFTIKEALKIAKESGAKRASFAYDPRRPLLITIRQQGLEVVTRGKFSVGLYATPLELVEILLKD